LTLYIVLLSDNSSLSNLLPPLWNTAFLKPF
jgi:hypothetical protein